MPPQLRGAPTPLPPMLPPVRRIFKRPELMHYNRLIALVLVVNALAGLLGDPTIGWSSAAVLVNLVLAVLIRQPYVQLPLYRLATSAPVTWPLRVRWLLGKVSHIGGLHVGFAVAATLWFLILTVRLCLGDGSAAIRLISIALALLLLAIVGTSLPWMRQRFHDLFERVHRFGVWAAVVLFWAQTVLLVTAAGASVLTDPRLWLLLVLTGLVIAPWLRLRRVPVAIERPSSHVALVHLYEEPQPTVGCAVGVSRRPLLEWHYFAALPSRGHGRETFRLAVSRAGDWSGLVVDDSPRHLWMKGFPLPGIAFAEKLFTRVLYVATGSGIGPCMPGLLQRQVPIRLLWVARAPRTTYGDAVVDEVLSLEPGAIIWDTEVLGKPDITGITYTALHDFGAEAVICISNKPFTWQVVYAMESRGIPAYGAIFDS